MNNDPIATIVAKEEIRDLVLLYARGINRKDYELLQSLYTADATDSHGKSFFATIDAFIARLREALPVQRCSSLFVCNHLISVNGDVGEGEVYALTCHLMPDGAGGWAEHKLRLRYLDTYRKESGRWRFASREMAIDHYSAGPVPTPEGEPPRPDEDASYRVLKSRLFQSGPRP